MYSTYNTVYKSSVPGQTIINNQVGQLVGATGSASGARYRKRANLALNWNLGDWGASWTMRHMSSLQEACNGFRNGFAQGQFTEQVCSDPNRVVNLPVGSPTGVPGISARNKIGSVTYHDAQVSWNTPFNSSLRLGIRNIGDKDPPYALNAFAGSYLQSYDIPGRFWYVGYTQNF